MPPNGDTETCPACGKRIHAIEKRRLPLAGETYPDPACIVDSNDVPATVDARVAPHERGDVAVVTHEAYRRP